MVWRVCGILCVCVCACVGLCVSGQCFLNETSRNLLSMSVCNLEVISFAVLVCVCVCVCALFKRLLPCGSNEGRGKDEHVTVVLL